MTIQSRTWLFIVFCIVAAWFLYAQRAILTPFIVGGIVAYLFNPVVIVITEKLKVPRILAILLIYVIVIVLLVGGSVLFSSRLFEESSDLRIFITQSVKNTQAEIKNFPTFLQPTIRDTIMTFRKSRFLAFISGESLFPMFSEAVSRIISFFIFLFSTFYFLKDGDRLLANLLSVVPEKYKQDAKLLLKNTNEILGGYLRGQIMLVALMGLVTFIALSILGIRFSFLIGLFSGFAEIVPVVGPITAAIVAILVVFFTGTANFGLTPVGAAIAIAIIYFVFRQLEDYFVMPYVFGKITKLPAFIIFFAVIAGGHIAGVLGLILAVPTAAIIKLFLEHLLRREKLVQGSE